MRRRSQSGQFVVLTAIVMAIVMLGMASQVYSAANRIVEFRPDMYKEVVENVNADYRNALTYSLKKATHDRSTIVSDAAIGTVYNGLTVAQQLTYGNATTIRSAVLRFLANWSRVTTAVLGGYGVSLNTDPPSLTIIYDWNLGTSNSTITGLLAFNLTSVGFTGFRTSPRVLLKVAIVSVATNQVNVTVTRELGQAVSDLRAANFGLYRLDTTVTPNVWRSVTLTSAAYTGGGKYQLGFTSIAGLTTVLVVVLDSRGIIVIADNNP